MSLHSSQTGASGASSTSMASSLRSSRGAAGGGRAGPDRLAQIRRNGQLQALERKREQAEKQWQLSEEARRGVENEMMDARRETEGREAREFWSMIRQHVSELEVIASGVRIDDPSPEPDEDVEAIESDNDDEARKTPLWVPADGDDAAARSASPKDASQAEPPALDDKAEEPAADGKPAPEGTDGAQGSKANQEAAADDAQTQQGGCMPCCVM